MAFRAYCVPLLLNACIAGLAFTASSAFAQGPPALPLDVGEAWVPRIFARQESVFSRTYVALAQERFEDVEEGLGQRAARDRYLEVYGIPPTMSVLRERLTQIENESCVERIDYEAISAFVDGNTTQAGFGAWPESVEVDIERWAFAQIERHEVTRVSALPRGEDSRRLALVRSLNDWRSGLEAVRRRLHCEGFLRGAIPTTPHLDWKTRASIEEFARRHRIYARGEFGAETLEALRTPPLELERRALIRVLAERARVDWGILEDGTGDGADEVGRIATHIEALLELQTVDGARSFLQGLGDNIPDHQLIPVQDFALPEDYSPNMDLRIVVDRGDVRYDPPFNEDGSAIAFPPTTRRPMLRVYVGSGNDERLLAEWPTTIGGWRQETTRSGANVWAYKQSAIGDGIWQHIMAAPVWLPPTSTPNETLVQAIDDDAEGHNIIRRTLLGPGYASAYGLVAAIHRRRARSGYVDEGIRTHGSVDYTSVFGDFSHGCHRLQNHLAVALFSFIVTHRPHRYEGPVAVDYRRDVNLGESVETLRIEQRGERFVLTPPVPFRVLEGRVVGDLERPSTETFPVLDE